MCPHVIQVSEFFPHSHHVIQVLLQNIYIYMSQTIAMIYLQSDNVSYPLPLPPQGATKWGARPGAGPLRRHQAAPRTMLLLMTSMMYC
jgi:hypothetical protein